MDPVKQRLDELKKQADARRKAADALGLKPHAHGGGAKPSWPAQGGWPAPGEPGEWPTPLAPQPWAPMIPGGDPFGGWAKRQGEADRQKEQEARRIEDMLKGRSNEEAREAERFARGVEEAQGPLGARHRLRDALGAGHQVGMIRCWAAIEERGWGSQCLADGLSETLMAAVFGRDPAKALAFLTSRGFVPGARLSSLALAAALANGSALRSAAALIDSFEAGSLDEPNVAALNKIQAGLGERARANGEKFELGESSSRPAAGSGPSRL